MRDQFKKHTENAVKLTAVIMMSFPKTAISISMLITYAAMKMLFEQSATTTTFCALFSGSVVGVVSHALNESLRHGMYK